MGLMLASVILLRYQLVGQIPQGDYGHAAGSMRLIAMFRCASSSARVLVTTVCRSAVSLINSWRGLAACAAENSTLASQNTLIGQAACGSPIAFVRPRPRPRQTP